MEKTFSLAWLGKGFTVDLIQLSDDALDLFLKRANEEIEADNARYESQRR